MLADVKKGKGTYGYNAATGEYGDMLEMGILDPTKVTRLAPQNAASVAGLLLTTEVMVAEAPKDEEHKHGGMPDMGGMGDMGMQKGTLPFFEPDLRLDEKGPGGDSRASFVVGGLGCAAGARGSGTCPDRLVRGQQSVVAGRP